MRRGSGGQAEHTCTAGRNLRWKDKAPGLATRNISSALLPRQPLPLPRLDSPADTRKHPADRLKEELRRPPPTRLLHRARTTAVPKDEDESAECPEPRVRPGADQVSEEARREGHVLENGQQVEQRKSRGEVACRRAEVAGLIVQAAPCREQDGGDWVRW